MPDFNISFEKMINNEGGYVLHKVKGDRGGQTYAGIARNFWPDWEGWFFIDRKDMDNENLKLSVKLFYKDNFWLKMKCDAITDQYKTNTIFDFAVNAGTRVCSITAQIASKSNPDGIIGDNTIKAINEINTELFLARFALAKISRYAQICNKNKTQRKFLLGWINRSLRGV